MLSTAARHSRLTRIAFANMGSGKNAQMLSNA